MNDKKNIPVARPAVGREELAGVEGVFATGWLGMGSTVAEFEERVKGFLGARHVIAVNTGTTALHLALDACGIGPGDEVITPSLTFCAAVQAITSLGARPVFCEIEAETLNIDVEDAASRITGRTRAIMPVHYCGYPCDMDRLLLLKDRNVTIVEDAAHAFGSSYKGRMIGGFGDVTCFSFDPIKNITCGEGGAVVVDDEETARVLRLKRALGITRDAWQRWGGGPVPAWFYEVVTQGYRYHMSNINAAIGIAQLAKADGLIRRRREIVKAYNEAFRGVAGLECLRWEPLGETAPFMYIIRVVDGSRDRLIEFLGGRGVGSGVHYIPNHLQPFFREYAVSLPVTERVGGEIITLPLYPEMEDDDVARVIDGVRDFFER